METEILQQVTIVDMNDEILTRVTFSHGKVPSGSLAIGWTIATLPIGLREFDVVYDRREARTVRFKVIDIELDLTGDKQLFQAYLEPQTLIIGQHDVGMSA